ncbi:MAG: acyl-CoA dehydratase activase [Treponema sp.]|jgi:predicted CoA-substrate-specific enzyme activase|nr:acyl-CoA dehydratase activase [Treponema sp.]
MSYIRYAAGIDSGSAFCKGALLLDAGAGVRIEKLFVIPSGWNTRETGVTARDALFAAVPRAAPRPVPLIATGYGRARIEGSRKTITEISAHAAGAQFLYPGVKTLIDIGGQDCKVITLEEGRVLEFLMNDKCAAGSGRFLEAVAARLGADSAMVETLLAAGRSAALNSTCVVFAESEITALIAQGVSREAILGGAADAMAARIGALAARLSLAEPAALSGGLSESAGIAKTLSRALGILVRPLERGIYAGAIGAALKGF